MRLGKKGADFDFTEAVIALVLAVLLLLFIIMFKESAFAQRTIAEDTTTVDLSRTLSVLLESSTQDLLSSTKLDEIDDDKENQDKIIAKVARYEKIYDYMYDNGGNEQDRCLMNKILSENDHFANQTTRFMTTTDFQSYTFMAAYQDVDWMYLYTRNNGFIVALATSKTTAENAGISEVSCEWQ